MVQQQFGEIQSTIREAFNTFTFSSSRAQKYLFALVFLHLVVSTGRSSHQQATHHYFYPAITTGSGMQKCTYFSSRSSSLLCVLLGAMEGGLLRQQVYLQLRIAISRDVVKLRENKVHLSEVARQVARVTNPRLINNSLQ